MAIFSLLFGGSGSGSSTSPLGLYGYLLGWEGWECFLTFPHMASNGITVYGGARRMTSLLLGGGESPDSPLGYLRHYPCMAEWGCLILAGLGWKYRLPSWWEWKPELYLAFPLIPPGCMAGCLVTASWGWKEIQAPYTAFASMGGGGATITLWDLVGVEQLLCKIFLSRLLFSWYFRKREQPFFSEDFSACIASDSWLLQF